MVDKKRQHPSWKGNTQPKPKPVRDSKKHDNKSHTEKKAAGKQR
jgi:hypothetical protein